MVNLATHKIWLSDAVPAAEICSRISNVGFDQRGDTSDASGLGPPADKCLTGRGMDPLLMIRMLSRWGQVWRDAWRALISAPGHSKKRRPGHALALHVRPAGGDHAGVIEPLLLARERRRERRPPVVPRVDRPAQTVSAQAQQRTCRKVKSCLTQWLTCQLAC